MLQMTKHLTHVLHAAAVLQRGEVANRILSVGSMDRALMIADQLQGAEPGAPLFQHLSGRGFLTITGAQLHAYSMCSESSTVSWE
jgi:hypothetical protein